MKRFLLFQFDVFYPSGGWEDLQGAFETFDEAKANIVASNDSPNDSRNQYWHIVDLQAMQIVLRDDDS